MPQVLTTNAVILCPHGGLGTTIPSSTKWLVDGGLVVLEDDVGILACPFVPHPCIGYRLRSMGLNSSTIDGRRVMLVTDFNRTFTGLPLLMTEFHTTIDDSTPTPIPPGQPAPPLSPALADLVAPVVTVVPPTLSFSLAAPVDVVVTFTLTSDHPARWLLTLINEPANTHADVTNGLPPGLTVVPAGGAWTPPTLTVTVAMTSVFVAALTAGRHHLYMTGVSQRGLSGWAECVLTVS